MTSRDEEQVIWQLTAAAEAAARLCRHVPDLHSLAFEKHVAGLERTSGTAWPPPGVEDVGALVARTLWARLCACAADLDTLVPLERAVANYFTRGPSPEGSSHPLVSKGDWHQQFKARDKRAARGDYTPVRIEEQPGYGGNGR